MHTSKTVISAQPSILLDRVNEALWQNLESNRHAAGEVLETARYAVTSGGHRWRPILFLKIYEELLPQAALGSVLPVACAIEYLHSASLILDDLPSMDDAESRRGKKTCHRVFGPAGAILASIWLCDLAQSLVHDYQCRTYTSSTTDLECLLRSTKADMIRGQYIDIRGGDLTRDEIIEKCRLKSGALYAFSASAPAHMLGLSDTASHLADAGSNLGIAYQISDDIKDIGAHAEVEESTSRKDSTLPTKYGISHACKVRDFYKQKAMEAIRNIPLASLELSSLVERICS